MAQAALIVEPIFSWHGIGAYFVESVRFRDLAVLQSCLLIFSIIFINVNLLVDKLDAYAANDEYVDIIISIIHDNKLTQYDNILSLLTVS